MPTDKTAIHNACPVNPSASAQIVWCLTPELILTWTLGPLEIRGVKLDPYEKINKIHKSATRFTTKNENKQVQVKSLKFKGEQSSVSNNPYSFNRDPDPAKNLDQDPEDPWIGIQAIS